jgi:uncharacterized protein YjbI with pentapeptide repeats
MNQQNQLPEKPKSQRRFNHWQYKYLKLCSKRGDEGIERWNQWRKKKPNKDILLEGANLSKAFLRKANLSKAFLMYSTLTMANCRFANFEGSNLLITNMTRVQLYAAKLNNAKLGQDMEAVEVSFGGISLLATDVKGGELGANLKKAILWYADLRGVDLSHAFLQKADIKWATFDSATILRKCKIDRDTDFRETSLNSANIDNETKQLLEYNIRRMNWEDWCKEHSLLKWLVKPFRWISDYGISTKRIIFTFFGLAFIFALLYRIFPDFVKVYGKVGDIRGFWHALYFSVVTMTTLGFGDIAANPDSWVGQTLLMIQVILGYVLLGALVTRFAVLFTAGGPAGKFADEKEKEDKEN